MIDPDGKIVLADNRNIYRINADGSGLDTTFGSSGIVIAEGIASKSIRREESGRYIVSGIWTSERNPIVQRYNNNGTFDTSFGFGGTVITDVGIPLDYSRITLQSDGKIILGGVSDTRFTLFRYLVD